MCVRKRFRKISVLVCAVTLAAALTACGSSNDTNISNTDTVTSYSDNVNNSVSDTKENINADSGEIRNNNTPDSDSVAAEKPVTSDNDSSSDAGSQASESAPTDNVNTGSSESPESSPGNNSSDNNKDKESGNPLWLGSKDRSFTIGETSGKTYTNTYLGISCTIPDEWNYLSETDIQKYNNLANVRARNEYIEKLKTLDAYFDMIALAEDKINSINITVQRFTDFEDLISENNYVDFLKDDYVVSAALSQMNFRNIKYSDKTIKFCGQDKKVLCINADVRGLIDVFEIVIPVKSSEHFGYISICTWGEDKCEELAGYFSLYE